MKTPFLDNYSRKQIFLETSYGDYLKQKFYDAKARRNLERSFKELMTFKMLLRFFFSGIILLIILFFILYLFNPELAIYLITR